MMLGLRLHFLGLRLPTARASVASQATEGAAATETGLCTEGGARVEDFSMHRVEDCKQILFVRHAEGTHNRDHRELPPEEWNTLTETMTYWDAPLTAAGIAQCDSLRRTVATLPVVDLVVVSPLRRAIQTAALGFGVEGFQANITNATAAAAAAGTTTGADQPMVAPVPFIATELCRERISRHTCDGRRNRSIIASDFPFVDLSLVTSEEDHLWEAKEILPSEQNAEACSRRALHFLEWLMQRPEKRIGVVSHWVFYTHLFALFPDETLKDKFGNAELREVSLCQRPHR